MGIIKKQTLSGSIFSYGGVLVGFVNLAVLSPIVFSSEQIGLPALIISISLIASQIGSLGFNNVTIRLFPYFRDKLVNHNGFLGLNFLIQTIGLIIVICGMLIFIPILIERNTDDLSMLGEFAYLCIPVIVFQLYFVLFDGFCRVTFNATLGIFLKEFLVRILNLIIIILYWQDIIGFSGYMYLYVLAYGAPAVIITFYLVLKNELKLGLKYSFLKPPLLKEIKSVSFYGVVAGLSGIAVISIDRYLINDFFSLSSVGVYSIAFYFGTLLLIPGRSMTKIAAPVIADSWKKNDLENITEIYRKSSINQFLAAVGIFVLLWLNVDDLFNILPEEYASGKMVIFYISLANMFTVLSGVSLSILGTSKGYKYSTYFMLALIILVIVSNIICIPRWGITGAAIATCISTFIYVVMRIYFLYSRYRLNPFSVAHLKILIAVIICYYSIIYIPLSFEPLLNIFVRVVIAGLIYSMLIYFLRCSDDVNLMVNKVFVKYFGKRI